MRVTAPTRIGFTGVRTLSEKQRRYIVAALHEVDLSAVREWTTGSQYGVDSFCAYLGNLRGVEVNRVIVPGEPAMYDPSSLKWANEVVRLPPPRTGKPRDAYRSRNRHIVRNSDLLLAFPARHEAEAPYSGTWATVRLARRMGVPVKVFMLPRLEHGHVERIVELEEEVKADGVSD